MEPLLLQIFFGCSSHASLSHPLLFSINVANALLGSLLRISVPNFDEPRSLRVARDARINWSSLPCVETTSPYAFSKLSTYYFVGIMGCMYRFSIGEFSGSPFSRTDRWVIIAPDVRQRLPGAL